MEKWKTIRAGLTKNWILLRQLFLDNDVICPDGSKSVYYQHLPTAQLPIRASPSSMGNCNLHMLEESLLYLGDTVYLGWKRFIGYPCLSVLWFFPSSKFKIIFCSIQRKNECWSPWFAPFRIWSCTIAIGVFLQLRRVQVAMLPGPSGLAGLAGPTLRRSGPRELRRGAWGSSTAWRSPGLGSTRPWGWWRKHGGFNQPKMGV